MMNFENKVVIVTGAASGIGAATALRFAQLSAQLVLVDKNEQDLYKSLAACEAEGKRNHLAVVADLSKKEDVFTVVPKTIEHYGKIDVLVNAAGIITQESLLDDDLSEKYEILMSVNLKAPIMLCNKAAPYLVETKGNVVNVSSIVTVRPSARIPFYCVSKAGLEIFTKCMASELAFKGVRANSIHPGAVRTNIIKGIDENIDLDKYYQKYEDTLPFGVISPGDIARSITFLASEDAKSITGSSHFIDAAQCRKEADFATSAFLLKNPLDKAISYAKM